MMIELIMLTADHIIPYAFDEGVKEAVSKAVYEAA